jgi:sulfur relay (sulfurtransferase) complex TusBCD TusD component (DsrE family)
MIRNALLLMMSTSCANIALAQEFPAQILVVPVGWPPLEETLQKVVAKKIQIFACGACSRARGVTDADLAQWGAKFGNPTIFVSLMEWADRIITE